MRNLRPARSVPRTEFQTSISWRVATGAAFQLATERGEGRGDAFNQVFAAVGAAVRTGLRDSRSRITSR